MFTLAIIGLVMSAAATAYGIVASQQAAARQAELATSASRAITVFFIDYQRGIDVVTSPFCAR